MIFAGTFKQGRPYNIFLEDVEVEDIIQEITGFIAPKRPGYLIVEKSNDVIFSSNSNTSTTEILDEMMMFRFNDLSRIQIRSGKATLVFNKVLSNAWELTVR